MKIVMIFSLLFVCHVVLLGSESDLYPRQLSRLGGASTASFCMSEDFEQSALKNQVLALTEKNKELESSLHSLREEISKKDQAAAIKQEQRKSLCATIDGQQKIIKSLFVALPVVAVAGYFVGKKYK